MYLAGAKNIDRIWQPYPKRTPQLPNGLPKLRVLRQNLPVRSAPPRANRVRDKATQRVASSWHFLGPHLGDLASSCFISESWPGGFLHAPSCGLASSLLDFHDRDYPGTSLETTCSGFSWGAYAPVWSYGDSLTLVGSHPRTVTWAPLKSWLGTTVPSLRPLASSWAQEPRRLGKSP
jgi:hypothetical protein